MTKRKMLYAKDYDCSRCKEVKAEVWVGMSDPDISKHPMCKPCANSWTIEVILQLQGGDMRES